VTIEYRWAEGRYNRLQPLAADLVSRRVNVIATGSNIIALTGVATFGGSLAAQTSHETGAGTSRQPIESGVLTHGIIPDQSHAEAPRISSPGIDEAHLRASQRQGELQWSIMSNWTFLLS